MEQISNDPSADIVAPPRPADVPDKFWDADAGAVRVDALAKSYRELEKHMSGMVRLPGDDAGPEDREKFLRALGVPETPDAYDFGGAEDQATLTPDPDVNRRLHEAGFSNDQAKLVYGLAQEYVAPLVEQAAVEFEAERQTERLVKHFGGDAKWEQVSRQMLDWGKANLPGPALQALATTYEGCLALHNMMQNSEPALARSSGPSDDASLDQLKSMMRDPRYWRDRDPAFIRQVTEGFERAYERED
tara:strand:+ start:353 stop:1090 length:738 start_codon:yes stop_codon:yes gene_type:complete